MRLFLLLTTLLNAFDGFSLDSLDRYKIDQFVTTSQWDSAKILVFESLKENGRTNEEKVKDFIWLSDIGLRQGNIAFQRQFIYKALELRKNTSKKTKREIDFAYANLLFQTEKLDSAKSIYHYILGKSKTSIIAKACARNLANIHIQLFKNDSAEYYCSLLTKRFSLANQVDSLFYFNLKGAIDFNSSNYQGAINWFEKMQRIYLAINDYSGAMEVFENISLAYRELGEFELALKAKDSLIRYLGKIQENSSLQLEKEMEVKYDTWEKELAIKEAKQEAKIRNIVIWLLSISLVIILPLLIWFNYSVRTIKSKNKQLKETHEQLATVNERLEKRVEERTTELEERNKRLERYAFATSHKLRKPLANILGLITLFADNQGNDQLIDMLEKSSEELDDAIRHMGEILDRKESKSNQSS